MITAIVSHTFTVLMPTSAFSQDHSKKKFLHALRKAAVWQNKTKHMTEFVFPMLVNHFHLSNTKFILIQFFADFFVTVFFFFFFTYCTLFCFSSLFYCVLSLTVHG